MSQKNLNYILGPFAKSSTMLFELNDDSLQETIITGLCADTRLIQAGNIFFAIKGDHHDSHKDIKTMVLAGARAVLIEEDLDSESLDFCKTAKVLCFRVSHTRAALSYAASQWYDRPQDKMVMIGVTGTDGKSSTVYFTWQLLQLAGLRAGFFSTVAISYGDDAIPNELRQSTPEPLELFAILAKMRENNVSHVVMESTSHGLSSKTARLQEIFYQAAAFTNLSHEHLEFHGSFENYKNDKGNLFRKLRPNPLNNFLKAKAIINRGDPNASWFYATATSQVVSDDILLYESELNLANNDNLPSANLKASNIVQSSDSVSFSLSVGQLTLDDCLINFPGGFNVENICAALLLVSECINCHVFDLTQYLPKIISVKGRMLPIKMGQDFTIIIDYAHTPGAFTKILPQLATVCKNRLILVFGSAGERDKEKRQMQGRLAAQYGQVLILTNEDPRFEDENTIIEQIKRGAEEVSKKIQIECIPNRRLAIERALQLAQTGDTIALLGKGHEQSIVSIGKKITWDEETQVREAYVSMHLNKPSS